MNIRRATLTDTAFITKAIIAAEKSNSEKCGFANLFGLTEEEASQYISAMLEEEIDGCEFSIDSFLIAEEGNTPVAAVGGWIEGKNSSDQLSSILKANLIGFTLPRSAVEQATKDPSASDLQFTRTPEALQIEYVYCEPQYRRKGITRQLIQAHLDQLEANKAEIQVYGNNIGAIHLYESMGFKKEKESHSNSPLTLDIFPSDFKILMTKEKKK